MGQGQAKLKKADMEFLLENTNFKKDTIKDWYESFKKDCPSGNLSKKKLTEVYDTIFPPGNAAFFADHAFRTFDTDNSGEISFTEFLMMVNIISMGTPTQKLNFAFTMLDVNCSGTVDKEELRELLRAMYSLHEGMTPDTYDPDQRAEEVFSRLDINGDGELTKSEFVQGCMGDQSLIDLLTPGAF